MQSEEEYTPFEPFVVGDVIVTDHAWDRWCERYPVIAHLHEYDDKTLKRHLKNVFKRALPEDLRPSIRAMRALKNNGQDAHYRRDKSTGLRFVINAPGTHLMTVEVPKFRDDISGR